MKKSPKIGVGVLVFKGGKLLLGKRKGSHGKEDWGPPGGHLEFGESISECAIREVFEETGIQIAQLKKGPYSNDIFQTEDKHYVSLFVIAEYDSGEVELKEPDKCYGWEWVEPANLPKPLFTPLRNILDEGFLLPKGS